MDCELPLPDSVTEPVEAHIDAFRSSLFHGVGGQSDSKLIVAQKWGGWLQMTHLVCHSAKPDSVLRVNKSGAILGFTGGGTTISMIQLSAWTAPFSLVGSFMSPKYAIPPATDRDLDRDRYEASTCIISPIFDLWNTIALLGYAAA